MEPRQDGVVTGRSVGIVAGVPNRVLVGASQNDDEPDVAGVEGAPLDTRQWERGDDICRYVFDVRRRKMPVWFGDSKHIQNQTLSRSQLGDSIQLITLFGKYRNYDFTPNRDGNTIEFSINPDDPEIDSLTVDVTADITLSDGGGITN